MSRFTYYKGSDRNFLIAVTQSGSPVNITGASITCNFKRKTTDTATILSKTTAGGGITITNGAGGLAQINMDEADFAELGKAEQEIVFSPIVVVGTRTYPSDVHIVNVVTVP